MCTVDPNLETFAVLRQKNGDPYAKNGSCKFLRLRTFLRVMMMTHLLEIGGAIRRIAPPISRRCKRLDICERRTKAFALSGSPQRRRRRRRRRLSRRLRRRRRPSPLARSSAHVTSTAAAVGGGMPLAAQAPPWDHSPLRGVEGGSRYRVRKRTAGRGRGVRRRK